MSDAQLLAVIKASIEQAIATYEAKKSESTDPAMVSFFEGAILGRQCDLVLLRALESDAKPVPKGHFLMEG